MQEVSDIVEQLKRAEKYENSGKLNESDRIKYRAREKLISIQEDKPSTQNISDENFRCKIELDLECVAQFCEEQISYEGGEWRELENAIQIAYNEIVDYENLE